MHITCSVVSYKNTPSQIGRVLHSVVASVPTAVLYLVDNSPDDKLAPVAAQCGARYIHLPHNPGFGAAHNVAIADALANGSDYHLVLNPDLQFDVNVMPVLLAFLEKNRDVGLTMPSVRYPDGRQQNLCKLLPGPTDLLMRRFLPALYRQSGRLARYELHASGYDKIMDVPALSGCFMLIRSDLLREVGAFDERFFMYLEDVDLSRRIGRRARTVYFPFVSVAHEYGKGSYKDVKLLFYHIRSAIQYFNKYGWFFDREKVAINGQALRKLSSSAKRLDKPSEQLEL
jgi:GT2 family glycosyltransferase